MCWLLCLLPPGLYAQPDFGRYEGLLNAGTLPPQALELLHRDASPGPYQQGALAGAQQAPQSLAQPLFQQGLVLVGDTVSRHVQHLAQRLLQAAPAQVAKLRFYVLRSPAIHAFVAEGDMAFITLGAIAGCTTEGGLAWMLSRLIAQHAAQQLLQPAPLPGAMPQHPQPDESVPGPQRQAPMEYLLTNSRYLAQEQIYADTAALTYYLQAGYPPAEVESALALLGHSYAPHEDLYFSPAFLEHARLRIPSELMPEEVPDLAPPARAAGDPLRFAPPAQRLSALHIALYAYQNQPRQVRPVSAAAFATIVRVARYELCLLYLAQHQFCQALYQAYALSLSDFNNAYLAEVQMRALYGLAVYTAQDPARGFIPNPSAHSGQITRVYHLFRGLRPLEVQALAFHSVASHLALHPADTLAWSYARHLALLLHQQGGWQRAHVLRMTDRSSPSDFPDSLLLTDISLGAMKPHAGNPAIQALFPDAVSPAAPRPRFAWWPRLGPRPPALPTRSLGRVHILVPTYSLTDTRRPQPQLYARAQAEQQLHLQTLRQTLPETYPTYDLLDPFHYGRDSMAAYNRMALLGLWVAERQRCPGMQQLVPELVLPLALGPNPYVLSYHMAGLRSPRKHKGYVLAASVLVFPLLPAGLYYYFSPQATFDVQTEVWDAHDGQAVYSHSQQIRGDWWRRDLLRAQLYQQLMTLKSLEVPQK
ncbi:MAG: hypothetical protein LW884_04745 [Bacteroidetes bacterium]|nr:hypothetical protein [Bacteroidota bacterium]